MKERNVTIATVRTERRSVQTAAKGGCCWSFTADIPEAELMAAGEPLAVAPSSVDLSSEAKRVSFKESSIRRWRWPERRVRELARSESSLFLFGLFSLKRKT